MKTRTTHPKRKQEKKKIAITTYPTPIGTAIVTKEKVSLDYTILPSPTCKQAFYSNEDESV